MSRTIRCRRCGQMFDYEGLPPPGCPTCMMEREEQYQIVRALVREFPGITAIEVNQVTEVPMEAILKYLDNGLLEVKPTRNSDGELDTRIGVMIQKARERRDTYKSHMDKVAEPVQTLPSGEEQKFTWLGGKR